MSNTNMNRKLSLTKNTRGVPDAHSVDIDLVYENAGTRLTFGLEILGDRSTSKSRENLMQELEDEWNGFLKVLKEEKLISDSFFKKTIGAQANTNRDIQTGREAVVACGPLGTAFLMSGCNSPVVDLRTIDDDQTKPDYT